MEDLEQVAEELEENGEKISELDKERERLSKQRKKYVVGALYDIQESLDEDESFALISSEDVTGAGHYEFEETLTPEGVVAENVRRVSSLREGYEEADSSELYGWPSEKEPLGIEEEYLARRGGKDNMELLEKLGRRITSVAQGGDELPQDYRAY